MQQFDSTEEGKNRKSPTALRIIATIYVVLYFAFFACSFIPMQGGNPVSDNPYFEPFDLEQVFVKLLFLLFFVGYVCSWKNPRIGGLISIAWFGLIVCLAIWVSVALHRDGDMAVVMALPGLAIGISFLVSAHRKPPYGRT